MNADQGLYDSLHHCGAVVGLNTSAMIEAGILDKPVLRIVTEEFAGGQEQTLHFDYLRAANGGLLARGAELRRARASSCAAALAARRRDGRYARFVERFVRPRGIDMPVTPIMVGGDRARRAHRQAAPPAGPLAPHRRLGAARRPRRAPASYCSRNAFVIG